MREGVEEEEEAGRGKEKGAGGEGQGPGARKVQLHLGGHLDRGKGAE